VILEKRQGPTAKSGSFLDKGCEERSRRTFGRLKSWEKGEEARSGQKKRLHELANYHRQKDPGGRISNRERWEREDMSRRSKAEPSEEG